jgi:hypothetical protein
MFPLTTMSTTPMLNLLGIEQGGPATVVAVEDSAA